MTLLIVLEHDRGTWVEANDEAMTAGRELAAAMGGSVQADNHPDGGALLSLALPLAEESHDPPEVPNPAVSQTPSAT